MADKIVYINSDNKKKKEELYQYLMFRRRGYLIPNKKKYNRKLKHKNKESD